MKRFRLTAILLTLVALAYVGCKKKSSPTAPGQEPPTNTLTVNPLTGTPTMTSTNTRTPTPGSPTATPTITETPLCASPFTFGKNFLGASSSVFSSGNLFASRYTLSTSGQVTKLHVYATTSGSSVRMALYDNNGSAPGNLLTQSSVRVTTVGWNTLDVPDTGALPAGTYWIAVAFDIDLGLAFDTGSTGDGQYSGMAFGPFPPTFSGGTANTWAFSAYADYCVGAATDTPVPTDTWTPTPTFTPTFTHTFTQTPLPGCSTFSFGKNWIGAANGVYNNPNIFASRFTLTAVGQATVLHAYIHSAPTPGTNLEMAIYNDVASQPGTVLAASSSQSAVNGWNNVDIPNTVALAPGTYWIALEADHPIDLSLDNQTTGDGQYQSASFGSFPSPFTGSGATDWSFSFYADYCVGAGTPTPVRTATWTPTPTFTSTPTATFTFTPLPACTLFSFGKNFQGGSVGSGFSPGNALATHFTLTTSGQVNKLHAYIPSNAGANIRMALYSNGASQPGTLIAASNPQTSVVGWNNVVVPTTSPLDPGTYWIALVADNSIDMSLDYGTTGDGQYQGMSFTGSFPSPFSSYGGTDWAFAFYADYCVGPATPTPVPTVTWTFTPTFTSTPSPTRTETPIPGCTPTTFGNTSPVGSASNYSGGNILATKFTLGTSSVVTKLHVYLPNTPTGLIRMALYTDASGSPSALLSQSGDQVPVTGWNTVDIPNTGTLATGTYWIAFMSNNTAAGIDMQVANTPTGVGQFEWYSYQAFPATFSPAGAQDWNFSFYAEKCP